MGKKLKKYRSIIGFLFALMVTVFLACPAFGANPIAMVAGFRGDIVIQSDTRFLKITQIGQPLMEGDLVQTKDGALDVAFLDGAVMKVHPYTTASISERDEETGASLSKVKVPVRRISCFVGKLRFKSGESNRKNYLQTPTSVCALRGSEADVGYDNLHSYLNMYSGEAEEIGDFITGFFADPGIDAATKNVVYQALGQAYDAYEKAVASGDAVDQATARIAALQVVKEAALALTQNASESVRRAAVDADAAADAAIEDAREALKSESSKRETSTVETTTSTSTTTTTTTTTSKETTVSPSS